MRIFYALLLIPNIAFANIGSFTETKGSGVIKRDSSEFTLEKNLGVESMDTILTENGSGRIDFVDDTRVDITEHSRLVIDEFVYDPNTKTGTLSLKASLGTVRYASGAIAKNSRQNVSISTPTATISVRGTDFAMIVNEIGGSMITLLPSCDTNGLCVTGEIAVESDAGMVIMNQAFQTTVVEARGSSPTKPIIIGLSESDINNLLILRKPVELDEEDERAQKRKFVDILNLDFLAVDGMLDEDQLVESIKDIWKTDLSHDEYLLQDLMGDIFDQINTALARLLMDEFTKYDEVASRVDGFDQATGITYLEQDGKWLLSREDPKTLSYFRLKLDQRYGYSIDMFQGDFEYYDYRLGSSSNNVISITQSNN
jgi:hypothetical protein|tara:strand:+ start:105 stop:1214 length:1110 start_codon:yes stop_codon:yes gene_type:complete